MGTIKKVELKNSILLTVLIFIEGAAAAVFAGLEGEKPVQPEIAAILLAAFALSPSLLAALLGTRQWDTFDLRGVSFRSHFSLQVHLHETLIRDLENKERLFRFSTISAKFTIMSLMLFFTARYLIYHS